MTKITDDFTGSETAAQAFGKLDAILGWYYPGWAYTSMLDNRTRLNHLLSTTILNGDPAVVWMPLANVLNDPDVGAVVYSPEWLAQMAFGSGEYGAAFVPILNRTAFSDVGAGAYSVVGGNVALLDDLSGNNLDLAQSSVTIQPGLVSGATAEALEFDLFDDAMAVTIPSGITGQAFIAGEAACYVADLSIPPAGAFTVGPVDWTGSTSGMLVAAAGATGRIFGMVLRNGDFPDAMIDRLRRAFVKRGAGDVLIRGDLVHPAYTNAVDILVYDTTQDSDGGAWRTGALAQASSWYTEALNTATRGSRREFPAVAVIVATASVVTIHDGDDPALPIWRVQTPGQTITSLAALNGKIVLGTTTGVVALDYAADTISGALTYSAATSPAIVNASTLDVAMTVLAGAPTAPATGLPVPTLAVATAGGVSVIRDNGTIVDLTCTQSGYGISPYAYFRADGAICYSFDNVTTGSRYHFVTHTIPSADLVVTTATTSKGAADEYYATASGSATADLRAPKGDKVKRAAGALYGTGVSLIAENPAAPASGMVAQITKDYNTGWMPGAIKGAWLASKDTASLVGGTDSDRSVNAADLTVNGTITRTAVATGAELVGYGGFSAANYLSQAYRAALDFGTGDFCVMGWANVLDAGSSKYVAARTGHNGSAFTTPGWLIRFDGTEALRFSISDVAFAAGDTDFVESPSWVAGAWRHFCALRRGGYLELYINAALVSSAPIVNATGSLSANAPLSVGNLAGLTNVPMQGGIALLRISGTAPSADQIAKIHADEAPLFQPNAACTLYGASDAVTALAHDPATGLHHVGTSAGRSVFSGLRRVANTTVAVTTAISVQRGIVAQR